MPKEHNNNLLELLFHLGHWHALAKLRVHTELTLNLMDEVTVALGNSLREFQEKTCSAYDTQELGREAGARRKRQAKAKAAEAGETGKDVVQTINGAPVVVQAGGSGEIGQEGTLITDNTPVVGQMGENRTVDNGHPEHVEDTVSNPPPSKKRKRTTTKKKAPPKPSSEPQAEPDKLARLKRSLNLNTYKNHSLGDYTAAIRRYGTTDSYSTESVRIFSFQRHFLTYSEFRENLNIELQRNGTYAQVEKTFFNS